MARSEKKTGSRIAIFVAVILVIGLAVAGAVALTGTGSSASDESSQPTFKVRRGPLSITVVESGTVRPREQIVIKSEVQGQNAILYLINEGAMVKPGDLLVELDSSSLADQKIEQQIRVQNAEASFIRARENLAVVENQSESDISKAELDHTFAIQDLKKYREGEYPKQLMQAENDITIAQEELQRAEQKRQWSEVLYKEKYISQSELQADELAAKKASLGLEVAKTDLDLLKEYTHPRELAQLNRDVEQKHMALDRTQRKAKADIIQAQADLSAKESEYGRQQNKLVLLEEQIRKTKIYAPAEGQVIYASSTQFSWRGNSEPLDEGQTVRERQELIHLPTTGAMISEIKIHEASLDKIEPGLDVIVTIDALPGRRYRGKVTKVAPLPDPTHVFLNPDLKVYKTEVLLTEMDEALRAGMSCTARILVDDYDDALFVPVQSVIRVDGRPTVYVKRGIAFDRVPVDIGLDNGSMIHITAGLSEGDEVMLAPPLSEAEVSASQEAGAASTRDSNTHGEAPAQQERSSSNEDSSSDASSATSEVVESSEPAPAEAAAEHAEEATGEQPNRRNRPDTSNMTPEQIEQMRERFRNMSPEERDAARQRSRQEPAGAN